MQPTATGFARAALRLTRRLTLALCRGRHIGTGKPRLTEREALKAGQPFDTDAGFTIYEP